MTWGRAQSSLTTSCRSGTRYFISLSQKKKVCILIFQYKYLNLTNDKDIKSCFLKNVSKWIKFLHKTRKTFASVVILLNAINCIFWPHWQILFIVLLIISLNFHTFFRYFIYPKSFCFTSKCVLIKEYLDMCTESNAKILSRKIIFAVGAYGPNSSWGPTLYMEGKLLNL